MALFNRGLFDNRNVFVDLLGAEPDINKRLMVKNCGNDWLIHGTDDLVGEDRIRESVSRMAAVYYLTFGESALRGQSESDCYARACFEAFVPFLPNENYLEREQAITKIQLCVLSLLHRNNFQRLPRTVYEAQALIDSVGNILVYNPNYVPIGANMPAQEDDPLNQELIAVTVGHELAISKHLVLKNVQPNVLQRATPLEPYIRILQIIVDEGLNNDIRNKAYSIIFCTIVALARRGSITITKLQKLLESMRKHNGVTPYSENATIKAVWEGVEQYVRPRYVAIIFAEWQLWVPRTSIEMRVFIKQSCVLCRQKEPTICPGYVGKNWNFTCLQSGISGTEKRCCCNRR